MELAFRAAIEHGLFSTKLTPISDGKSTDYNLGEHYETIQSLADALFQYITQDSCNNDPDEEDEEEPPIFPRLYDPNE
jgi:hypothetical protein